MNRFFIDYNQLKTLDKDLIRLYHEEAGKRMADLKEIESLITDRAYRLFSIYYAVEIAVVGYVLTQIDKTRDMGLINAGMAIVVFTAISLWYVVKVMRPHGVMPAGRSPENFQIGKNCRYFEENRFANKYAYIMAGELMNLHRCPKREKCGKSQAQQCIDKLHAGRTGSCRTGLCPYGCFPVNPGMSTGFDHQNFPFHLFRWECHNLHPV